MDGQSRSSAGLLGADGLFAGLFAADRTWILLLLALVLPLRVWLLCNTTVTARDSITFIHYAHKLDTEPWIDVLKSEHQHPGFPVAVWLVGKPLQAFWGKTAETMQLAAQLVSLAVASLLLALVVMFRLAARLRDRSAGLCGALLFQFFPGSGHHLSDGISEGLFLLCFATSLWLFVRGAQCRRIVDFALGGAGVGFAYLTRPEGLARDRGFRRLLGRLHLFALQPQLDLAFLVRALTAAVATWRAGRLRRLRGDHRQAVDQTERLDRHLPRTLPRRIEPDPVRVGLGEQLRRQRRSPRPARPDAADPRHGSQPGLPLHRLHSARLGPPLLRTPTHSPAGSPRLLPIHAACSMRGRWSISA